jgi:hypothetical protein
LAVGFGVVLELVSPCPTSHAEPIVLTGTAMSTGIKYETPDYTPLTYFQMYTPDVSKYLTRTPLSNELNNTSHM